MPPAASKNASLHMGTVHGIYSHYISRHSTVTLFWATFNQNCLHTTSKEHRVFFLSPFLLQGQIQSCKTTEISHAT